MTHTSTAPPRGFLRPEGGGVLGAPDVLGAADDLAAIGMVEDLLRAQHRTARDANVDLVNRMVAAIVDDPAVGSVDAVAARFATTPRMLQRLFARYVGVPPAAFLRGPG